MRQLNVVVIKASKYLPDGSVERFWRGFMPNATVPFIASMIPAQVGGVRTIVRSVDEYVYTDTDYLNLLDATRHGPTLVLLVGIQSHQFHRALDIAALAHSRGCMVVLGGPHPITCDTSMYHGKGPSFALAEAEVVLDAILTDAVREGRLRPTYGHELRWAREIDPPVLKMPSAADFRRYLHRQLGVYPARGCPYICDFCAIIKIAGRNIRSQPVETTMATLRAAKAAGVTTVFLTSDNFNKYAEARELCEAIIEERLGLKFFVQCDVQIERQPDLLELFARAGVYQIFLGVESLDQATLKKAQKNQNNPKKYRDIKRMFDEVGITANFSMIVGFPGDTYDGALAQLAEVKDIDPGLAWFYTLSPIPGTSQYDDFLGRGLIFEKNLDRFDGTTSVWHHPSLSPQELHELFRRYYLDFYTWKRAALYRPRGAQTTRASMWAATAFMRHCARTGNHPMAGGVLRRRVDHVDDYLPLRLQTYGIELAPLPVSLKLSAADEVYNSKAKIPKTKVA